MTTEEPSTSFAECTWAIDAAAMGTGSIKLKILSMGPNSFSIVYLTVTQDSGRTSSRHFLHSAIRGSGNIPSAAEINCASLT